MITDRHMTLLPKLKYGVLLTLFLSLSFSLYAKGPQSTSCLIQNLALLQNLKSGHLAKNPDKFATVIAQKNKELDGLAYEGIVPWSPRKRDAVKRFMIEKFGMDNLSQELPAFDPTQKLGKSTIKIDDIRWSQVNARNVSQDGKYTVIGNAKAFKDGTLNVDKLPPIRVWRDTEGLIWTLDHRRLAAMKLSGVIDDVPVIFVDNATVKAQKFKFGTHNDGNSLFVWLDDKGLDDDLAIVLVNKSGTPPKPVVAAKKVENPLVSNNLKTGHVGDFEKYASVTNKFESEISHLDHQGVIPWGPKSRDAVKRFFIEKFNMGFMAQKRPPFDKAQKLGKAEVEVKDIRFSQIRCRNSSQDGKYSVLGNAKAIQEGKLKVSNLPTIRVWRDTEGRIWTLDHRRLAAIRLSGKIDKVIVEFVDEAIVEAQKFKFDTLNEGKTMFVWVDDAKKETDLSVIIAPENASRSHAGQK